MYSGEEISILSERHKEVLQGRLQELIKVVTTEDLLAVRHSTPLKLTSIHSKKDFVLTLMGRAKLLHEMLFDEQFGLSEHAKKPVLAGLMYFISSNDFLRDDIPGLGYLDDAYVIGLALEAVKEEAESFLAFKNRPVSSYI